MSFSTNISASESNTSYSKPNIPFWHEAAHVKGIKIAACVVLLAVSLVGNSLLLTVVYKNANHRMRTPSNYFIFNMACADILLISYSIPQIIATTANDSQWLFGGVAGELFCRLSFFIIHVSLLVSTHSLLVIAWDRFFLVFFPLKKIITLRIARRIIIVIWLFAVIFALPLFVIASLIEIDGRMFCYFNFEIIAFVFVYFVFCFTLIISIPMLVTITLYTAIGIKLKRRKLPGNQLASNQERRERMNCKLLAMLLTVVAVLIVCRFPLLFGTVACFTHFRSICSSREIMFVGWFLTLANSGINPWIYFIFNQQFRQGASLILKNVIPCCFDTTNEVDAVQSVGLSGQQTHQQQQHEEEETELKTLREN